MAMPMARVYFFDKDSTKSINTFQDTISFWWNIILIDTTLYFTTWTTIMWNHLIPDGRTKEEDMMAEQAEKIEL